MTRSNPPARPRCVFALLLISALALAFTRIINAATDATDTPQPPPAVAQTIDTDLAALKALSDQPVGSEEHMKMTTDQRQHWWKEHCRAISDKAFAIYKTYKNDPRHWNAVPYLFNYQPWTTLVIVGTPEAIDETLLKSYDDPVGEKEYESRLAKIDADMDAATDVPADVREGKATRDLQKKLDNPKESIDKKQTFAPDLTALRAAVDTYLADYPHSQWDARDIFLSYVHLERQLRGTPEVEILKTFAQSPNSGVRDYTKRRLAFLDIAAKPVEMKFTAADGREVDLAKLRGKVVLISFWATWCGCCTPEHPPMKALYSKYHDKGLEIIGIALEDAELSPKDTPEQTEKKLADAKKALLDFVEKEQMPWPQYFDGKGFKTDYPKKYDIPGVPTMFLLGKDGVIALEGASMETNKSSEEIEEKVKHLLGL